MTGPTIDPTSAEPPFEQIRRQVAALAAGGTWPPGHRLDTVRALADDLGVAVNTVAKAYKALEADGVIETRGRAGSFVAASRTDEAAATYAARAKQAGLTLSEAQALVEQQW